LAAAHETNHKENNLNLEKSLAHEINSKENNFNLEKSTDLRGVHQRQRSCKGCKLQYHEEIMKCICWKKKTRRPW